MPARRPLAERFAEKVIPEPNSGCHLWFGASNSDGYGHIQIAGRPVSAHRVAWELSHATISSDQNVLHRCDTPACVNPEHLYLGSRRDNMQDKVRRGRYRNGFTGRTHCGRGHEFAKTGTYDRIYRRSDGQGSVNRECRVCVLARQSERKRGLRHAV